MTPPSVRRHAPGFHPLRKFRIAWAGIQQAVLLDFSVLYKLILSVAFLVVAALFETLFHFLFVLTVTGLMLTAEVFNTAIEAVCDHVEPDYHSDIKTIKDIAAAGAMIAILLWYTVAAVVLYEVAVSTELFTGAAVR